MKYKLRGESSNDIIEFIKTIQTYISECSMNRHMGMRFPDVELEFETELTLDQIKYHLMLVDDSHVMAETVMPIEDYTGDRKI